MNLGISDDFMDELLKYEYQSKKKGRGASSILLNKVGKGKKYQKKSAQNDGGSMFDESNANHKANDIMLDDTIVQYPGGMPPMDVKKYYDKNPHLRP